MTARRWAAVVEAIRDRAQAVPTDRPWQPGSYIRQGGYLSPGVKGPLSTETLACHVETWTAEVALAVADLLAVIAQSDPLALCRSHQCQHDRCRTYRAAAAVIVALSGHSSAAASAAVGGRSQDEQERPPDS